MSSLAKYIDGLKSIPPPGGNGCHPALLAVANLGILSGLAPGTVYEDLRAAIPEGSRPVSDLEIREAVDKATGDHRPAIRFSPPQKSIIHHGPEILQDMIAEGRGIGESDFHEASPVRIDWPPEDDAARLLSYLYEDSDLLFIGDRQSPGIVGNTIRPVWQWVTRFASYSSPAHIIVNPLDGLPAKKKVGTGYTYRGDGNVAIYRFCVVEFDNLSREDQLAFWASVDLPISVLVDSGGKSIHGWLDVAQLADVTTLEAWKRHIRYRLYSGLLVPLGVDVSCSNPARLSRLPGHNRDGKWQRLLYLSPRGRKVF